MSDVQPIEAVVFDLDGVITKTALVHAAAWKKMFDDYLRQREVQHGEPFKAFTHEHDYLPYVDGKPRYKGVQSFLESRNIDIPFGDPSDRPDQETVCGLGNKKNDTFVKVLEEDGVEVYPSTVALIKELIDCGIHVGVASSSKNCQLVLQKAGLEKYFETRVDGVVSAELGLQGKPEGDIFVRAAENMGCQPAKSIVVEDAVSGVQAGKNGGFGLVIGIAREGNSDELKANGADVVIEDFDGINVRQVKTWFEDNKN
ncbi:MAG: beta-phosphoglucomutase family hydrolase [Candidatus Omnitrophica bacterium]|nr:beta-phosphoglucomutase family hydrolase [Candidatus Omnitrophota bacterium]